MSTSTRFRVSVRRDELIDWIRGLLTTPFVLHAHLQPAGDITDRRLREYQRSLAVADTRKRYATIWFDIEAVVSDHRRHRLNKDISTPSKLQLLVPHVGDFFTELPLRDAFLMVDRYRFISSRRFVSPSFNDVRHVLAVAQLLALARSKDLKLATFDGDVTLYDHGEGIEPESEVLPLLVELLKRDTVVCILTAAGYPDGVRYKERYHGLLAYLDTATDLTDAQKSNFCVMGAECNYLFRYSASHGLQRIDDKVWFLPEMASWTEEECVRMLDVAQGVMEDCIQLMQLPATIIRKQRSVGMVPTVSRLSRETLEEVVMACQRQLSSQRFDVPWCAFNDCDVWVDVGDKAIGARCLQNYLGGISPAQTLHVGDQFSAAAGNDFRTRTVGTTLWVTGPSETVEWLKLYAGMTQES